MKVLWAAVLGLAFAATAAQCEQAIVRIEDPSGSHCIDATSEDLTLYVRRIFTEKKRDNIFTTQHQAGVIVTATLTGFGTGSSQTLKIPSVNLVDVSDDKPGRVSLALEYPIASFLTLKQDALIATNLQLDFTLAKTQALNTFGKIIIIAGNAMNQVPIPNNPFADTASKILAFANATIKDEMGNNNNNSVPFGTVALAFNKGKQDDLQKCENSGKERTGAVAIILSTGLEGATLIPTQNTSQLYCFSYSSDATYELLAAQKINGKCPDDKKKFVGIYNDYVMLLLSAQPTNSKLLPVAAFTPFVRESAKRCDLFGLEASNCGIRKPVR